QSSPIYNNVSNTMLKDRTYDLVDDELPLPPPPTPVSIRSTSWSDQAFPPPPTELDTYVNLSEINENRRRNDSKPLSIEQHSSGQHLYANLNVPQSSSSRVARESIYEIISKNDDKDQQFSQQRPTQPKLQQPNFCSTNENSIYANLNIQSNRQQHSLPNNNNNKNLTKHLNDSENAIYTNLSNLNLGNSPNIGGIGYKHSSAPIKNSLRVNRSSATKEEDEVDHLTDLLVKSMENSAEPDFFGMCNKCGEKVVGEGSGCTAMEMVYHIKCFTCFECHKELRGKSFYAMENSPYCEECYLNTLEKCSVCEKPILDRILRATGKPYHPNCFTCVVCKKCLDGIPFTVDAANQIHCIDDFHKIFAPRCSVCNDPIVPEPGKTETVRVVALERSFHVSCYKCEDCDLLLSSEAEGRGCYPLDDHILCRSCNAKRVQALSA
ncbi:hypothetical protein BLOT_005593, partial [Blomia tropicalis]